MRLRSASESVGWLNSEGPLDVAPRFEPFPCSHEFKIVAWKYHEAIGLHCWKCGAFQPKEMAMVPKHTHEPCSRCGAARRVVNPAWLRERRRRAGLSLREMARRLEFSPAYISDVETGKRHAVAHIVAAYEAL